MEKRIRRKTIYKGRIVNLVKDTVKIGNKKTTREIAVHPGSVVIIPLLPNNRIVLIKQYRYAIGKYIYELPAGTLEPGEAPARCARRELTEETGFKAGKIKKITNIYPAPGIVTENMRVFLATNLTRVKQNTEFDEDIKPFITTIPKAARMIKNGKIKDAKTIAGILMLNIQGRR